MKTVQVKPPHYYDELSERLYTEFRADLCYDPFHDEDLTEKMGTTPEKLILDFFFKLFQRHHDEEVVRALFAKFGPKEKRRAAADRERLLLSLYLSDGLRAGRLPQKAKFARKVADFNKTKSPEKRLGSRSTSELNLLQYVNRMLEKHRDYVQEHMALNHHIFGEKCSDKHS
jgi:hypothetical protein